MEYQHSLDHESKDELLALLADQHRRSTLVYFLESADEVASLRELSAAVSERSDTADEEARVQLHHSALPRLDSAGVVDYDAENNTVQYRGHPELETLVGLVAEV
ncbi:hypothetical protein HALDL1_16145 [Halobacterium sp. DL1]|jgi:hypothetical protein|nr:hypothetical protein HALDL1_16145 [Halobacterium sp. DL1]